MNSRTLRVLFFLVGWQISYAQQPTGLIEKFNAENIDVEALNDELETLFKEPLDINQVQINDLHKFPHLTIGQKQCIIKFIDQHKPIKNFAIIYQKMHCLSKDGIRFLLKYFSISPQPITPSILKKGILFVRTRQRIDSQELNDDFIGPETKFNIKWMQAFSNDIDVWMNIDKDSGELWWNNNQTNGIDYFSLALQKEKTMGLLRKVIVGDFEINIGEGLVIKQGFGLAKSFLPSFLLQKKKSLKAHSGSGEGNYFRGIAGELKLKRWSFTHFFSYQFLDATINKKDPSAVFSTRIYLDGIHNTSSSLNRINTQRNLTWGAYSAYHFKGLGLGLFIMGAGFDPSLQFEPFTQGINDMVYISLPFSLESKKIRLKAEVASRGLENIALVESLNIQLNANVSFFHVFRYYQYDYWALYSQSFNEYNRVRDEWGNYFAFTLVPDKNTSFLLSIDQFAKIRLDETLIPQSGYELGFQFEKEIDDYTFLFRFKNKIRTKGEKVEGEPFSQENKTDQKQLFLRTTYKYKQHHRVQLHLEHKSYKDTFDLPSISYGGYINYSYRNSSKKLGVDVRIARYHIDNANVALFHYENDVLYNYSFFGFFRSQYRMYINTQYRMNKKTTIYFKTTWENQIFTAIDRVHLTLQLRLKL